MKKLMFAMVLMLASSLAFAQTVDLKVTFKFINIEEGYDHECKTQVLIDGQEVGVSPTVKESAGASFVVQVPTGSHTLKVVNWALYEGTWEEHTIANNYSIDCVFEETHNFKKAEKLFLIYDIDDQTLVGWKKAPKVKKKKGK